MTISVVMILNIVITLKEVCDLVGRIGKLVSLKEIATSSIHMSVHFHLEFHDV